MMLVRFHPWIYMLWGFFWGLMTALWITILVS
jgi:hypothetical protein